MNKLQRKKQLKWVVKQKDFNLNNLPLVVSDIIKNFILAPINICFSIRERNILKDSVYLHVDSIFTESVIDYNRMLFINTCNCKEIYEKYSDEYDRREMDFSKSYIHIVPSYIISTFNNTAKLFVNTKDIGIDMCDIFLSYCEYHLRSILSSAELDFIKQFMTNENIKNSRLLSKLIICMQALMNFDNHFYDGARSREHAFVVDMEIPMNFHDAVEKSKILIDDILLMICGDNHLTCDLLGLKSWIICYDNLINGCYTWKEFIDLDSTKWIDQMINLYSEEGEEIRRKLTYSSYSAHARKRITHIIDRGSLYGYTKTGKDYLKDEAMKEKLFPGFYDPNYVMEKKYRNKSSMLT